MRIILILRIADLNLSAETIAAVLAAYEHGMSMTQIVEEVLGRRGPHFVKGRQLYFQVIQQYRTAQPPPSQERDEGANLPNR